MLVHGEAERTDMVEFFGQELEVGGNGGGVVQR